ncbi:MTW1 Kinetochore-associated protein MTW1 [Candida maltosa Xu316]
MYRGITAVDVYLKEQQKLQRKQVFKYLSDEEISVGMGKLESLLESTVDKNFDKYELYCRRNIFSIPEDLIGYVRLSHHEGIDFKGDIVSKKESFADDVKKLEFKISQELQLRKLLKLQLYKIKKLMVLLREFANVFKNLKIGENATTETKEIMESLQPVDETIYYINSQVKSLIDQISDLTKKVDADLKHHRFVPRLRERFIEGRTMKVIEQFEIDVREGVTRDILPKDLLD